MAGFSGISVDALTIRRARQGDQMAYEAIYRAFAPAVFTLAVRLVGERSKAEDVLQETFIEIMRSIGSFRGDAGLGTWIRRIAVSKGLMLLRSSWERKGQSLSPEVEALYSAPDASLDDAADLGEALAALEPQSRAVVWLHDVEGYTHAEIGALLQKTSSYSKSRLSRAHRVLRDFLTAEDAAEFDGAVLKPC